MPLASVHETACFQVRSGSSGSLGGSSPVTKRHPTSITFLVAATATSVLALRTISQPTFDPSNVPDLRLLMFGAVARPIGFVRFECSTPTRRRHGN